jgi:hypothetical protein
LSAIRLSRGNGRSLSVATATGLPLLYAWLLLMLKVSQSIKQQHFIDTKVGG